MRRDFGRAYHGGIFMFYKAALRSITLFTIFSFVFSLCTVSLGTGEARAEEPSPLYIGEVMADASGDVYVLSSLGERLKMDSYPMPIFTDSLIQAEKGVAIVSLAPDGLVELVGGSEAGIKRVGERNIISLKSGALRFTVPTSDILSIIIPSEGISITPSTSLASTSGAATFDGGEKAGFVELREDGSTIVTSSKGSLVVSTADGNSTVLPEGGSFMIAKSDERSRRRAAANISRTHDLLTLGATIGIAGAIILISNTTDSGGGFVASGP